MKLISVSEMQAVERQADQNGLTYANMMENAGKGLAECVHLAFDQPIGNILALVGSGNNGGDALVALDYLAQWGWSVTACLVRTRPDGDPLVRRVVDSGGEVVRYGPEVGFEKIDDIIRRSTVLMDGLLGTGIRLPLKAELAGFLLHTKQVIDAMSLSPYVVAVDCPSGVDCDTGDTAPETLTADMTVTMAAVKQGLLRLPAFERIGELRLVSIGPLDGLSEWEAVSRRVVNRQWVGDMWPNRPLDGHKGTFGTALIAAGSANFTGAALLAGRAAYRIGTGLVTLAVPESLHATLAGHFPEATWVLLPEKDGVIAEKAASVLLNNLNRVKALLLGPGFGLAETTQSFMNRLVEAANLPPLVIDADGLKLLAQIPGWSDKLSSKAVLTPHPGEMSILTGLPISDIQDDRIEICERYARDWGQVVVLKGAFTVIAAPDGRSAVIPVASPALARAGSGDVLAGMVAGLLAQGLEPYHAAAISTWIHAQAGLSAARAIGNTASVLAGDIVRYVPQIITDLAEE